MTLMKLSFRKMISLQLPFVYENSPASTTDFLLLRLMLACKLSGLLAKLHATELCVLTFSFLCCVFAGVKPSHGKLNLGYTVLSTLKVMLNV